MRNLRTLIPSSLNDRVKKLHCLTEWTTTLGDINSMRLIPCLVDCYLSKEYSNIVLQYEKEENGKFFAAMFAYNTDNCPPLYFLSSVDYPTRHQISIQKLLIGYDEESNCYRPFVDEFNPDNKYRKWPDLLSNSYSINWTEIPESEAGDEYEQEIRHLRKVIAKY